MLIGFEPRFSGVGSNCSTNFATIITFATDKESFKMLQTVANLINILRS